LRQPNKVMEVVVAGGGLAGSAAAIALAKAGVEVTLIEREAGPVHKICGEFLSAEAQAYLARLGLDIAAMGGVPVSRLRLIRGDRAVTTALPFQGLGLSRFTLDEALLDHAAACGVTVLRGHSIRSVGNGDVLALDVKNHGVMRPKTLFLASGKHELRGAKRAFDSPDDLIGFKNYFRLAPQAHAALEGCIELILFQDGYAGLQLVENGLVNLCLLVSRSRFDRVGGKWVALFEDLLQSCPYLARELAGATQVLEQPLAIYRVPFGFVHKPQDTDSDQIFRLGDQAGVIHSFTGDGMSIALHSASLAAECYLNGDTSLGYHRRLSHDIRGQIDRAGILYTLNKYDWAQAGLFGLARLWPAGLRITANLTRLPPQAMACGTKLAGHPQ
jgi:flavin-dependent dehydrogenase